MTSSRTRVLDIAIVAGFIVLAITEHLVLADFIVDSADFPTRERDGFQFVVEVATILTLLVRRNHAVATLIGSHIGFVVLNTLDYTAGTATQLAVLLSFYGVAIYAAHRTADIARGAVLSFILLWMSIGALQADIPAGLIVVVAGIYIGVWAVGNTTRARQQNADLLEERAERAEREQHRQAHAAVQDERSRIARELHDVVAHSLTVMTVQAAGARRVMANDPDAAEDSLAKIESTGREALAEMRRMIGVMRNDDTPPDLAPQPGVETLDNLIESTRASGLEVEWEPADLPELSAGMNLTIYRIVQEALTNTIRHGGPNARAVVDVRTDNGHLLVQVSDDGRGGAVRSSGGHGLVGMAERVALFDGSLRAGPAPGGGFAVKATIPIGDGT